MTLKLRTFLLLTLAFLAAASQACAISQRPTAGPITVPTDLQPAPTDVPPTVIPAPQNAASTPRVAPSQTIVATPTAPSVTITATGGNLAIHAGPDNSFDAIAALKDGQTVPVYARSIQDGWVEVPIPSQKDATGWVYTGTGYSNVSGYVLDLPLITTVEWPFGAYLSNCTPHQLIAQPGDIVLPPVTAAPANRVWFFPGLYTLYDADVAGKPAVGQVKLYAHTSQSTVKDGTGQKYTCP